MFDISNFYNIIINPVFLLVFILVLTIFFVYFYKKLYNSKKLADYYLDIIRTVSKGIQKSQELIAFDESQNVIYTTHPKLYHNKQEFIRHIISKVKSCLDCQSFCDYVEKNKNGSKLLDGLGNGLQNQSKKWIANCSVIEKDESLINQRVSVVSIYDVTKYMMELDKLERNHEKLEQFIDNFPFGIFYVNNLGTIIGANNTFSNLVRSNRERVIGSQINDFIDDFNYNLTPQKPVRINVKPRFSSDFEAILIKSSQNSSIAGQPWIIYKFEQRSDQIIKKDVDEFLSQESFILAPVPSVISNRKGNIIALNPAFATMIQDRIILDDKDKIISEGTNLLDIIHPDSNRENLSDYLEKVFVMSENPNPIEIKFIGGNITAMAYINKIPDHEKELLLIQLVDISGQKRLEQQFIQSQKMQAIGQLAGGIAHDFNNLLTAMIGFCDLLLQRHTPNDASYSDVIQIKQNASRAANLVRQLLAFSRQQNMKPRVVSVTEILAELTSLLKRLIGADIEYQIIHGRDIWPIKVDNSQFEQVIINLAVNARDAMENGGKLTIKTKNFFAKEPFKCIFDTARMGDYVLIEVSDTGIGIEPEIIENIFEPFFTKKIVNDKSSSNKKLSNSGTGLGLSTVYGIINQTGGYINVISEVGKGSTFQIFIPRYTGNETIQSKNIDQITDLSGSETILLVEDEEAVRMFSSRALRDKGYKVLEASSGEEALKIIQNGEKFDLLITDVVMPKIDGPTLNNKIRENIPNLKTIFISGYSEDTFRQDLGRNSNIHFLQKPFSLKDLAKKVKEVISEKE